MGATEKCSITIVSMSMGRPRLASLLKNILASFEDSKTPFWCGVAAGSVVKKHRSRPCQKTLGSILSLNTWNCVFGAVISGRELVYVHMIFAVTIYDILGSEILWCGFVMIVSIFWKLWYPGRELHGMLTMTYDSRTNYSARLRSDSTSIWHLWRRELRASRSRVSSPRRLKSASSRSTNFLPVPVKNICYLCKSCATSIWTPSFTKWSLWIKPWELPKKKLLSGMLCFQNSIVTSFLQRETFDA